MLAAVTPFARSIGRYTMLMVFQSIAASHHPGNDTLEHFRKIF